jgi:hypothetical protein
VTLIGSDDGIAILDAIFVKVGYAKRDDTIPTPTTSTTTTPEPGAGGGGSTSLQLTSFLISLGLLVSFYNTQT